MRGTRIEPIIVEVSGGVVQAVKIPAELQELGIQVAVHDYDVDGEDESRLDSDGQGDGFVRSMY